MSSHLDLLKLTILSLYIIVHLKNTILLVSYAVWDLWKHIYRKSPNSGNFGGGYTTQLLESKLFVGLQVFLFSTEAE